MYLQLSAESWMGTRGVRHSSPRFGDKDLVGSATLDSENAQTDLAFKQDWIFTKLPECPSVTKKPLFMFAHRRTLAWEVDVNPAD